MRFPLAALTLAIALAQPRETPFDKWVNQDVVYIITPQERVAFQDLKSDAERTGFIEQFWLRRDPTPETQENECKEEHYRRIAYSNDRFGSAKTAGWKTDRGRMYITYGPPDEIESHPSAARESWRYHLMQGAGTNVIVDFIDVKGTGDYPMTTDPRAK